MNTSIIECPICNSVAFILEATVDKDGNTTWVEAICNECDEPMGTVSLYTRP